jgi:hypothetical protein
MSNTPNLGLPLVQASQAQKHVTVNDAFLALDAITQLVVKSRSTPLPPLGANEGDAYAIPTGAVNEWAGREAQIAIYSNGGWLYSVPRDGWSAWVLDEGQRAVHLGGAWVVGSLTASPNGANSSFKVLEADVTVPSGGAFPATVSTPSNSLVFGVTGRVLQDITGTATSWEIGASGASNRYGSGLGLTVGSYVHGLTSAPLAYYSGYTPYITPVGGAFTGGSIRMAIHYYEMTLPSL